MRTIYEDLQKKIQTSYEEGITQLEAEKLAGEFLNAQLIVSNELRNSDLDTRMKKAGLKAVRAAVYKEEATKGDKKPTEAMLTALVDSNSVVQGEQDSYDAAEVEKDNLERYYNIFREAHLHFRTIAKGQFGA